MTDMFPITQVMPHKGKMNLLDKVIDAGPDHLVAQVLITEHSLFYSDRGVPAWVGLEYMAQAIAAQAGVLARQCGKEPPVGFLVGTRSYRTNTEYFPLDTNLTISIERAYRADNGLGVFDCSISGENITATCALNVFQPTDVNAYLEEVLK
ncbi:MAG TPA: hypothetical protein DCZ12_05465 [Gammaproteobacteria bacterium]|nr:hypothetical protein [Gammaproteobacteria bacterium]